MARKGSQKDINLQALTEEFTLILEIGAGHLK